MDRVFSQPEPVLVRGSRPLPPGPGHRVRHFFVPRVALRPSRSRPMASVPHFPLQSHPTSVSGGGHPPVSQTSPSSPNPGGLSLPPGARAEGIGVGAFGPYVTRGGGGGGGGGSGGAGAGAGAGAAGAGASPIPPQIARRAREAAETTTSLDSAQDTTWTNQGLLAWERQRLAWRSAQRQQQHQNARARANQARQAVLNPDVTYEDLLLTNRPFPVPVPLQEMVDLLVDVWDEEGLYDAC